MIADFKSNKQNYTDIKTMIEETRKRDNESFGQEIVNAAQAIREKRDQSKAKKDFIAEHKGYVKNWENVKQGKIITRLIQNDKKHFSAA